VISLLSRARVAVNRFSCGDARGRGEPSGARVLECNLCTLLIKERIYIYIYIYIYTLLLPFPPSREIVAVREKGLLVRFYRSMTARISPPHSISLFCCEIPVSSPEDASSAARDTSKSRLTRIRAGKHAIFRREIGLQWSADRFPEICRLLLSIHRSCLPIAGITSANYNLSTQIDNDASFGGNRAENSLRRTRMVSDTDITVIERKKQQASNATCTRTSRSI